MQNIKSKLLNDWTINEKSFMTSGSKIPIDDVGLKTHALNSFYDLCANKYYNT